MFVRLFAIADGNVLIRRAILHDQSFMALVRRRYDLPCRISTTGREAAAARRTEGTILPGSGGFEIAGIGRAP